MSFTEDIDQMDSWVESYNSVINYMDIFDISAEERDSVNMLLAAVLHIGDMTFAPHNKQESNGLFVEHPHLLDIGV